MPATRLTERIMAAIRDHLKPALAGHPHPYNRSYEAVHRILTEELAEPPLPPAAFP